LRQAFEYVERKTMGEKMKLFYHILRKVKSNFWEKRVGPTEVIGKVLEIT